MNIGDLVENKKFEYVAEIKKGWSGEKKYYIRLQDGMELLLRISPLAQYNQKVKEFNYMKVLYRQGQPISKPLELKVIEEKVFSLFKWVVGNDSEEVLPLLSEEEQYRLGVESGEILKQIHQLEAPADKEKWERSYQRKINRNIDNYLACSLKYEKGELFLKYVKENQSLIARRPLVFQHGDFHTGNMILSPAKKLSIIDFNRWSYGDPWEEFNRIDFTAAVSPIFATGQVNGYFSARLSNDFFKLLLLYISTNTLNALPWALNYSTQEVQTMKKKARDVLAWYDDLNRIVPSWYDEKAMKKYRI